jgi:hypothetical protein
MSLTGWTCKFSRTLCRTTARFMEWTPSRRGPVNIATLLEQALLSGTAAAVSAEATDTTKKAFSALTSFMKRIFTGNAVGEKAVEKLPEDPVAWTPTLSALAILLPL